jgi:predicted RNA binding protein YcfA (HicA-like mRNA interferase family)
MKIRDLVRILEADGWFVVRVRGSHRQFHHSTKPGTASAPSAELHPKTLRSILKQAGIGKD